MWPIKQIAKTFVERTTVLSSKRNVFEIKIVKLSQWKCFFCNCLWHWGVAFWSTKHSTLKYLSSKCENVNRGSLGPNKSKPRYARDPLLLWEFVKFANERRGVVVRKGKYRELGKTKPPWIRKWNYLRSPKLARRSIHKAAKPTISKTDKGWEKT